MTKKKDIEAELDAMIRRGAILPGNKLPSIRALAKQYNVSMTPVIDAYNSLVSKGMVESRPGAGYYVSTSADGPVPPMNLSLNSSEHYSLMDDFIDGYSGLLFNAQNDIRYYFGSTSAASSMYPEKSINAALARAVKNAADSGNYQAQLHDDVRFKENIMKWMQPCRCKNSIDDISVVRSVTEGVMLGVRACTEPGGLIAVEAPGHAGFYFIAKFLNCKVLPVPSHPGSGLDIDAFNDILHRGIRPACLLVTSNFSNPTGALMSDENKERLVRLCAEYGVPIIEDDVLGELYFAKSRPRPLKSFDNENVIYVSGFGKCLTPALRTGYVSAGRYYESFAFEKHLSTAYTPTLIQQGLSDFLETGLAQKHISFFRKTLRSNMETYRSAILSAFPQGTELEMPAGGAYLWVTLPPSISADELCILAKNAGISLAPGRLFNAGEAGRNAFRFNCIATAFDDSSIRAVDTLGQLAHTLWLRSKAK